MRTSALFAGKLQILMGVESVRTFCGQGVGVKFSRFCADVFYRRPLQNSTEKKGCMNKIPRRRILYLTKPSGKKAVWI